MVSYHSPGRRLGQTLAIYLLSPLCLCSLKLPAAEIYHWVDDRGRHHYSDHAATGAQRYRPHSPIQPLPDPQLPTLSSPRVAPSKGNKRRMAVEQRHQSQRRRQCQDYEKRILRLNTMLRGTHSNAQGNRWRRQRRDYQARHWKHCR